MLETEKQLKGCGPRPIPVLIALILFAGLAVVGYFEWKADAEAVPVEVVLTDEARAYLPKLDLHSVEMGASESALGHTLVEITGVIGNIGERPVKGVKLNCVFYEINGIELDRVRSTIVRSNVGLAPGAETSFRLAFDAIPGGWNQTIPNLFIAEIVFAD